MDKQPNIICFGGGGHAHVVMDVLSRAHPQKTNIILDNDPALKGSQIGQYHVVDSDDKIDKYITDKKQHFIVTIGTHKVSDLRAKLYRNGCEQGLNPFTLKAPSAIISDSALIGSGTVILTSAVLHPQTNIGQNTIINTGAIIEHHAQIGDHTHIAPGALICGGAQVGENCIIGAGAIILPGIKVGDNTMIGAGSVVTKNIGHGETAFGNPAHTSS